MYLLEVEMKSWLNLIGIRKIAYDLFPSTEEARKVETLIWIKIANIKRTKVYKVSEYSLRVKNPKHTWAA